MVTDALVLIQYEVFSNHHSDLNTAIVYVAHMHYWNVHYLTIQQLFSMKVGMSPTTGSMLFVSFFFCKSQGISLGGFDAAALFLW